jgi:hypothetical protein
MPLSTGSAFKKLLINFLLFVEEKLAWFKIYCEGPCLSETLKTVFRFIIVRRIKGLNNNKMRNIFKITPYNAGHF